ncbi:MAG: DUF1846 domain-containing protein [Clostridia bacterium]|nr:DUF1846 domain-containing protein [Clostridia bacterium]
MRKGFDNAKYMSIQSECIRERIAQFGGKLYLEFGGKLFDDFHASRVLPGFEPDSKIRMLATMKDDAEIIIAINAEDIEQNKRRGDLGITYDDDVLRLADAFRSLGLYVGSVVITRYSGQSGAEKFKQRLAALGMKCFLHYSIPGYPSDIAGIVSEEGYGKNDYIETQRPLVVVTAPGPGSGKMATCLSQLYHENKRGIKAGYAKFETFPIWNLPLKHPVNIAYEAATADLDDINMIDPFHLEAYGKTAVNYNRDVEIFPVLRAMMTQIMGECPYKSPTDMGVNMAGFCIYDDEAVREAANMEILRRYYRAAQDVAMHSAPAALLHKNELIVQQAGVTKEICPAINASILKEDETEKPAGAMVLPDGKIVTGKTSSLLGASAALLLNALKNVADIDDSIDLISPETLEPICQLKTKMLGNRNPRLHSDEVLIALAASSFFNPNAKKAMDAIPQLHGCDAHFSVIISSVDEKTYKKLGINVACEPRYEHRTLYHK